MTTGRSFVNVDELQARTTLEEAAACCGVRLAPPGDATEVRLDCVFHCDGDHAGRREIAVNVANPQKVFCCHAYGCQVRGNLLTLMHGWTTGTRPTGDKLKGEEFARVRDLLAGKSPAPELKPSPPSPTREPPPRNVPLARSDNPEFAALAMLHEKLVTDIGRMSPKAAGYVRKHPALTEAMLRKWQVGYLPSDGGGDKRGWSLRGSLLYPILAEDGQVLAYAARDPAFEEKEAAFQQLSPEQRKQHSPPVKHRFPKNFHRGQELYGQHASRLAEPGYCEALLRHGLVIFEGFNDVIALDALGIPAVAIMSNRMTDEQAAKIERFATQVADRKILLFFDADTPGDAGAKEALWHFSQRGLKVRLGWTGLMHNCTFAGREAESCTPKEWTLFTDVAG